MVLLLFGILILNFVISWFNAWSVGKTWAETKQVGGWIHLVNWAAAIMSACGFTWVYLTILSIIAGIGGWLPYEYIEGMQSLGYLIIILPVLGSGITLTVHSWVRAWRERNFRSVGVAGWNTFAQTYNTVRAVSAIPDALGNVLKIFGGRRKKGQEALVLLALLLIVLALVGGTLTTIFIIRTTMRKHAENMQDKIRNLEYNRTARSWSR